MFNMPCSKRKRGNPGGKRGIYSKRKPARYPFRTTTSDGYKSYMRMYMSDLRRLKIK